MQKLLYNNKTISKSCFDFTPGTCLDTASRTNIWDTLEIFALVTTVVQALDGFVDYYNTLSDFVDTENDGLWGRFVMNQVTKQLKG